MKIYRCLFCLLFVLYSFQSSKSKDWISWEPTYKLTWRDFKGEIDSTSSHAALSYCGISYNLTYDSKSYKYLVNCYFDRSQSWTSNRSKYVIEHEQGHFDIAKLFALKLEKLFKNYKYNKSTVVQDFRSFYTNIENQRDVTNRQYDEETNVHITDTVNQYFWNRKIRSEIAELMKQ